MQTRDPQNPSTKNRSIKSHQNVKSNRDARIPQNTSHQRYRVRELYADVCWAIPGKGVEGGHPSLGRVEDMGQGVVAEGAVAHAKAHSSVITEAVGSPSTQRADGVLI